MTALIWENFTAYSRAYSLALTKVQYVTLQKINNRHLDSLSAVLYLLFLIEIN
jgi:hypothetical protein